jgi:RimJ/RimL family protein N-acetyltransferase
MDATAIFERYAGDPEVTRFLGWPTHRSLADTEAFLKISDSEWERWPAGPYLVLSRADGMLLGSSGFTFETPYRAATGYVLARDAWGQGYATETLRAIMEVAPAIGVLRLYALCHPQHRRSWRVLEKCGFEREGTLRRYLEFPNLKTGVIDVLCYAIVFGTDCEQQEHAG